MWHSFFGKGHTLVCSLKLNEVPDDDDIFKVELTFETNPFRCNFLALIKIMFPQVRGGSDPLTPRPCRTLFIYLICDNFKNSYQPTVFFVLIRKPLKKTPQNWGNLFVYDPPLLKHHFLRDHPVCSF